VGNGPRRGRSSASAGPGPGVELAGGTDVEDGDHAHPGTFGLAADAPGFHPARPPPQTELPFADEAPDFVADAPPPKTSGRD
jgi:hypothetical protein